MKKKANPAAAPVAAVRQTVVVKDPFKFAMGALVVDKLSGASGRIASRLQDISAPDRYGIVVDGKPEQIWLDVRRLRLSESLLPAPVAVIAL